MDAAILRALALTVALAMLGACSPAVLIPPISKEKPWCYGDLGDGCPTDPPPSPPVPGSYKTLTRCPKGSRDYACPALGAAYAPEPPSPGEAIVYIYRPRYAHALVSPYVYANGQRLSDLPPEGYFVYRSPPGQVVLTTQTDARSKPLTLDVRAGESYYVSGRYEANANLTPPEWFQLMAGAPGYDEQFLKKCRLVPAQGRD
jgi:hypothetical protein